MVQDDIDYRYKQADRRVLDEAFALRDTADDVLIVRHGLLTDTSIANIALWDGCEWHTPHSLCWPEPSADTCSTPDR